MNYIEEDKAFERWCEENYLPILAQAIWKKLFKRFNRCGWCEWVQVDNLTLMAEVQIRREDTFIGYRNKLLEAGLIEYEKGKKGSPNKYKLISIVEKNTFTSGVQNGVETGVYSVVQSGVQTVDITKRKTKTETKTKPGDILREAPQAESSRRQASIITLTLNDKSEYPVTETQIEQWSELYPAVDIMQELRKMRGWLIANPKKRKTRGGISRFINSWLSREQDRGGRQSPAQAAIPNSTRPCKEVSAHRYHQREYTDEFYDSLLVNVADLDDE